MRVDRYQFKGVSKRSDIEQLETVPLGDRPIPNTTYEALKNSTLDNPKETALSFFMLGGDYKRPFRFTYQDVFNQVNSCANMLSQLGVGKGDVVGIILPNLPETCFSLIAAATVGVAFPINPLLDAAQLKELMIEAKVKVLITLPPLIKTDIWQKVESIRREVPTLEQIVQVDVVKYLRGGIKTFAKVIVPFLSNGNSEKKQRIQRYDALTKKYKSTERLFELPEDTNAVCVYFHTGGTTGRPKIAQQTHRNLIFNAWSTGNNINTSTSGMTMFGGLPLFHVFGEMITLNLTFAGNGHLVLVSTRGYRGKDVIPNFWKIVEHYKVNFLAAVPAIYKTLNDLPVTPKQAESVEFAICGAAPMPIGVLNSFEKKTGVKILEGYGCTEGACIISVNPPYGERRAGSVGFPIPYTNVKTVQLNDEGEFLRDCAVDEIGHVCFNGDHLFNGYLDEEHNKGIWVNDDKGALFYNTGDLGRIDDESYLWLTGRKKELIIRGGHNIDPKQIEEPFYSCEGVEIVAAVGRPDEKVGEVPVLYVQLNGNSSLSVGHLMTFAKENITERAAVPKEIILIDEMPMTTIEKIFKPKLVEKEVIKVYQGILEKMNLDGRINIERHKTLGMQVKVDVSAMNKSINLSELETNLSKFPYAFQVK